jgi:hypothetical protein
MEERESNKKEIMKHGRHETTVEAQLSVFVV